MGYPNTALPLYYQFTTLISLHGKVLIKQTLFILSLFYLLIGTCTNESPLWLFNLIHQSKHRGFYCIDKTETQIDILYKRVFVSKCRLSFLYSMSKNFFCTWSSSLFCFVFYLNNTPVTLHYICIHGPMNNVIECQVSKSLKTTPRVLWK